MGVGGLDMFRGRRHNEIMSQAFFAIAGTIVGVLGTIVTNVATNFINAKREDVKAWQEALRSVVSELTSEVLNVRGLSHRLREYPEDKDLRLAIQRSFTRVQTLRQTLRLTSKSQSTQEAGYLLTHYIYWVWRIARGDGGLADFDTAVEGQNFWMRRLYAEVRKELGLGESDFYERPDEGLPIPMAKKKVTEEQTYSSEVRDQPA
jgi:hypothetical protein